MGSLVTPVHSKRVKLLHHELIDDAMRRALVLATRSPEHNPNPRVGCVILSPDGRIVAEGWHRGAGTPHAEVDALTHLPTEWAQRGTELTAVVTLEPCNHTGRTGPCAVALIEAGIGNVVFALRDPGEAEGGGAQRLRDAGVVVSGGVREHEARALLAPWLAAQPSTQSSTTQHTREPLPRPWVTVKWAQTLDGRAAAANGSSQWITGADARGDVHRRRAEADVIIVGTGTLLADDPALTARAELGGLLVPAAEQPVPVVLGRRRIPATAQLHSHPALAARGFTAPLQYAGDDLAAHLADLHERGFRHVFVEGGPAIASAFLAAGLVDQVLVYVAPALLGGPKLAIGDLGITDMSGIARLRVTHMAQLGADVLFTAAVMPTDSSLSNPNPAPEQER